jgi:replicative DNA helicase
MALHSLTKVILFDGRIKELHELSIHDKLMGEDSTPRNILRLCSVKLPALSILPHRGQEIIASTCQKITLRKSEYLNRPYYDKKSRRFKTRYRRYPNLISIPAGCLYSKSIKFKRSFLLTKAAIDYSTTNILIDPYFLGIWLGDGHQHIVSITSMDREIIDEVYAQASIAGLRVSINSRDNNKADSYAIVRGNVSGFGRRKNPLRNKFGALNLMNNKHIPNCYLFNTEDVRLKLLAGLIDSDGYLDKNVFYISQKIERLAYEIYQLANSLSFRCSISMKPKKIKKLGFVGDYYHVSISGKIDKIPTRLKRKQVISISDKYDRKQVGYKIQIVGFQELIRIQVDGTGRFLLVDGTIIG